MTDPPASCGDQGWVVVSVPPEDVHKYPSLMRSLSTAYLAHIGVTQPQADTEPADIAKTVRRHTAAPQGKGLFDQT